MEIKCFDRILDLSVPRIMGILNITPDSFYDGGRYHDPGQLDERIDQLVEQEVDIIDVGGMSTRPGAELISPEIEAKRVLPVIEKIKSLYPNIFISVDTIYGYTAEMAIKAGVDIINDVSAFHVDKKMKEVLEQYQPAYILMHNRGKPENMSSLTKYDDLIHEIGVFFAKKLEELRGIGVEEVIIDPGFGFAKNLHQNYLLLKKLASFQFFEKPILSGLSRKSMFYKYLKVTPEETLLATQIGNYESLLQGAKILRVHDVAQARQTIKIWQKIYSI